jgi:predicted transcriptional regulator
LTKHGSPTTSPEEMVALTSRITAAFLRGNALPAADIASVISTVHGSLLQLIQPAPPP